MDHPQKGLANTISFQVSFCQCLPVGLHQDIHEGFEETEDQPAVDHLDVGGWREVSADTNK